MSRLWNILLRSARSWWNHDPFTTSAAVSYYTIFSLPALCILYFAVASLFVDNEAAQSAIYNYLGRSLGAHSVEQIRSTIENTSPDYTNFRAFVIGGGTLLFAALRLFMQLQKSLNIIWDVNEADKRHGILTLILRRVASFAVMTSMAFILLVSLVVTTVLTGLTDYLSRYIGEGVALLHVVNLAISYSVITIMFAVILKGLPDVTVRWRYALSGAAVAAVLFMFGEYMLGIYFHHVKPQSAYGVTGSLILLMLWVSYSCVILLFGAEISRTVAGLKSQSGQGAHHGHVAYQ